MLNDENKSLNEYRTQDFIKDAADPSDPFDIVKLEDILITSSVSTFVSVLIKEYLLSKKNSLIYTGIRFDKNQNITVSQIKNMSMKNNGFRFYRCNNFYNVRLNDPNPPIPLQQTTHFIHIHIPHCTVSFVDDKNQILSHLSPIVLDENGNQTTFNYKEVYFLFCDFSNCINNTLKVVDLDNN